MKRGSLLLVDDDRHLLESMAEWLRGQGYRVDTAASQAAATAALARKRFDLMLADIRLGEADGFQLLAHCRELYPHVTVLMMTGYGSVDSAVEAIRAGAF